ncbi:MAG: FmdB family zinc ribbon protein [Planctomycetota bacterium]
MPTYVYDCESCGHVLETFQSIKDDPLRRCPKCKKLKLTRRIGAGSGILFKGSGFYETDYRSSSYEAGKKADGSGSKSDGNSKPGGDSKPSGSDKKPKSGDS